MFSILTGQRMPEVKRFGSWKLLMFSRTRIPRTSTSRGGPGFAAKVRISSCELLAGNAPSRVLDQARRWIDEHRAELLAMWDEFQR
jgi:hypothetical protein